MKGQIATKFIGRLVAGLILAILIGDKLDKHFHISPLFVIMFIIYAVFGSLYLLVRDASDEDK